MFEYSSNPQIPDLSRCRLCFDNQASLIHIFETTGSLNEVARTISEELKFEVSAEDHFPPYVCSYCSAKLFDFRAFKAKCYSLRETYKLILQRKADSVSEVTLYNVPLLPMKVEAAVVGDGIGVSEQIETEQKSKDSAFKVAVCSIKTELFEDEDEMFEEVEMSEEAENDQVPERHDGSLQSRKPVWFQMNPPDLEVHAMLSSDYPCASEQRGAENVPKSSSYHLDRYPISNRKLGAEGEVRTCISVSGMDFPDVAAAVSIPEMADNSSGQNEAYGYHAGSYKPQKKDVRRENPPHWEEEVFGGWQIDNSREEESGSGKNRNGSLSDEGNSGVALEMENDMEYVRCHHCGESKLTKDELKRHIYSAHPSLFRDEVMREVNGKLVRRQRCTLCLKDFQSRAHLVMHFTIHTGEKPFLCNFCGYRTRSNSYLTVHLRRHTGQRPFKCTMCDFATVKGADLKRHIRTHTGERPYKCKFCNYTSASKPELKQHHLIHTGEKPYKCTMCEYSGRQKSALRVHLLNHSKEKPFQCHICGLGYMSGSGLNVHLRSHMGEKPYKCDFCEYRATYQGALNQHLVSHGVMPNSADLNCKKCGFNATTLTSLKRHVCLNTPILGEYTTKETSLDKKTESRSLSNVGDPLKGKGCENTTVSCSSLEQYVCKSTGKLGENSSRVEATLDKVAVSQSSTVPVNREDVTKSKECG